MIGTNGANSAKNDISCRGAKIGKKLSLKRELRMNGPAEHKVTHKYAVIDRVLLSITIVREHARMNMESMYIVVCGVVLTGPIQCNKLVDKGDTQRYIGHLLLHAVMLKAHVEC
jgi:hypothetical protein